MNPEPVGHTLNRTELSAAIKAQAKHIGFDLAGIAPAVTPTGFARLAEWLERGYAGAMGYLEGRKSAYEHPRHVLEGVKSVIVLAANYHTQSRPSDSSQHQGALVASYAWGTADYHDVLRDKLKELATFIHEHRPACRTRGVVDTAPLLERDFAVLAGLGWIAKNTMLINKQAGSWLFLCALLTDIELDYDAPHETSHCGTCTRCLDACPTDAFPEPFVLDARRCISYLTIELREAPIPHELRPGMGNWVFGCDVCQDVCPWNHEPPSTTDERFLPTKELAPVDAVELLSLSQEAFDERFRHTPLSRPKRSGLLRNAAIVLGNSGDQRVVPALIRALQDDEPLVRGAAAWALGQLGGPEACEALQSRLSGDEHPDVHREIQSALDQQGGGGR